MRTDDGDDNLSLSLLCTKSPFPLRLHDNLDNGRDGSVNFLVLQGKADFAEV